MTYAFAKRIVIVGGGASGTLVAAHLLRRAAPDLRVTIVEKRERIARGRAYETTCPDHLLNVRVANMSAYADDPDHLWRWLLANGEAANDKCSNRFCFIPRQVYGRYLEQLLARHLAQPNPPARVVR